MGRVYCSLNRGDHMLDNRVGCASCRATVSIVINVPYVDEKGAQRVSQNNVYCLAELAEYALRNHLYFHKANLSLQFTSQTPLDGLEGLEE